MHEVDKKLIISHLYKKDNDWVIQSNEKHQSGVARLAGNFAAEFLMRNWGILLGLLHDKGKEKHDFQYYIRRMNEIDAPAYSDKRHAYVGALLASKLFPSTFPLTQYPLLGHHAGLCNYTNLEKLVQETMPSEIKPFENKDICLENLPPNLTPANFHHLVRVLYSCLVDADYLDTEAFMDKETSSLRIPHSLGDMLPKLNNFLKDLQQNAPHTQVNDIRKQVQKYCRESAKLPTGVFSLTVPTGGGKTLSSLLWAISHAIVNNKKRIIIAIPYTSIISQTAATLRIIFGEENVLEHHCNYFKDNEDEDTIYRQHELTKQNWDAPIVVTTNVQLFESMYASRPGRCRKLHNIVNSVIILDEAQTLSGEMLQPIVDALKAYNLLFGTSILFTTASQPTLEGVRKGHEKNLQGFSTITEIIPSDLKLHEQLKRVDISFIETPLEYDEIAQRVKEKNRILCVVNTRKDAAEIFKRLNGVKNVFHLSRMMCSAHIDNVLDKIRAILKEDCTTPVRIVSTQLIEAGVDIDLPVVIRQEAGLDSILQAAGRCNREGKGKQLGKVTVFCIKGRMTPPGTISYANQARKNMPPQEDWFSPEAIADYFTRYYRNLKTFDKCYDNDGNIEAMLYNPKELQFETAAHHFQLIDSSGVSIVVPYGDSAHIIQSLKKGVATKSDYRKINRYVVNVTENDFQELYKKGMVEQFNNFYVLTDSKQYSNSSGLSIDNHWTNEILIQ